MAEAVGPESFRFAATEKQDFGFIESISPVFLTNEKDEVLIRNPFHYKATENGYRPIEMCAVEYMTNAGNIKLPKRGEYDAKQGYYSGYVNISGESLKWESNLFDTKIVSGNRKNGKETDDSAYFKRELISLEKGYSFAVLVDMKENKLPEKMIVYMGQKKSSFQMSCKPAEGMDLQEMVRKAFPSKDTWYYVLSDIYVAEPLHYESFCIVEEKYQRNLETVYKDTEHHHRLRRGNVRFHLIKSGSVFFEKCPQIDANENCEQIGYNRIVQLGGR